VSGDQGEDADCQKGGGKTADDVENQLQHGTPPSLAEAAPLLRHQPDHKMESGMPAHAGTTMDVTDAEKPIR
jgi:hypothetical protein